MSFFEELKRRNVVRVAIAYAVVAWLVLQFSDVVLNNIEAPGWVFQTIMLVLGIGFLLALFFAWAFEMTPEGIKKEKDVDRSQSITTKTGRKLDFTIIGLLVIVAGYFFWESRFSSDDSSGSTTDVVKTAIETPSPQAATHVEEKESSIAVLPFANRSSLEDDEFFSDGIHDDLLTQLAKISDLKVISRTSMMKYKDTQLSIPEIATELGVSTILEGGIQRAGGRVRINAQLIDVTTDEHLWAETFDREMTIDNIFDIQSEITRQIVTAVRGELADDQLSLAAAPTQNVQAYEAYLRGRAAQNRPDYMIENFVEAKPWFERAVELDSNFAEAWALLSSISGQIWWLSASTRTPEVRKEAEQALSRALTLKPDAAIVLHAQGDFYYRFDEDYEKALTYFLRARDAAPGNADIHVFTGITQRRAGYWNEAIQSLERALELDPSNNFTVNQLIDTLGWMHEWDRVKYLADTYVLRFPESRDLRSFQAISRIYNGGDLEGARELMDLLPPWQGNFHATHSTQLALYERNFDEALRLFESPMVHALWSGYGGEGLLLMFRANVYAYKGEMETAKSFFQQALDNFNAQTPQGLQSRSFRMQSISRSLMMLGDQEGAMKASLQAIEYMSVDDDHLFGAGSENNHTWILAKAGQVDEALSRLEAKIDQPEGLNRWDLKLDPQWDFLRDNPRFAALATPQ